MTQALSLLGVLLNGILESDSIKIIYIAYLYDNKTSLPINFDETHDKKSVFYIII